MENATMIIIASKTLEEYENELGNISKKYTVLRKPEPNFWISKEGQYMYTAFVRDIA